MLLKDYKEQNTLGIAGISTQLCAKAVKLGFLVPVVSDRIVTDSGSLVHLYLQPKAAASLIAISREVTIVVSTAYRTLAQQFILHQNLNSLVAPVGHSDHGSGRSVDITNYQDIRSHLNDAGWEETYGMRDAVHFDYPGADERSNTILVYQHLHNDNCTNKLDLDGICGDVVLEALANSPCAGWPIAECTRVPLSATDSGWDVGALQFKLRSLGYFTATATGSYDINTQQAVAKYQKVKNLTADGVAGMVTLRALGLI